MSGPADFSHIDGERVWRRISPYLREAIDSQRTDVAETLRILIADGQITARLHDLPTYTELIVSVAGFDVARLDTTYFGLHFVNGAAVYVSDADLDADLDAAERTPLALCPRASGDGHD